MRISVIGPGRWGSFIAWYLSSISRETLLYGRETSADMRMFMDMRTNGTIMLGNSVRLTTDIVEALSFAEFIAVSISAQNLRSFFVSLPKELLRDKIFILCMKGIEKETGLRLSQIASELLPESAQTGIWVGPGHPQEFLRGVPNCMVLDSESPELTERLVETLSGGLIRFYYGADLIGNELGAAAKNVIGIAAGMLDGLGLSSLKGALMSRGTREVSRLIEAMGGSGMSAYGLAHLGDYEATVFSRYSNNRAYGEAFAKGEPFSKLAEGIHTAAALEVLSVRYGVELPICAAVQDLLVRKRDINEVISSLFIRSLKREF